MFVYQHGKLYVQDGSKLIGVSISPDKTILVEGTETTLADKYELLSHQEVQLRFNIMGGGEYVFPVEKPVKVEVVEDEPIEPVKRTPRKPTRK